MPSTIPRGTDFTVQVGVDPAGDPATSVELTVNAGTPIAQPVAAGVANFLFPGGLTTPGVYALSAVSVNAGGRSPAITDTLEVVVRAPNAPVRLTIIVG